MTDKRFIAQITFYQSYLSILPNDHPFGRTCIQYGYAIIIRVHYQKCIKKTHQTQTWLHQQTRPEKYTTSTITSSRYHYILPSCVYFNNYSTLWKAFTAHRKKNYLLKMLKTLQSILKSSTTYEHTRDQRWCLGDHFSISSKHLDTGCE